MTSEQGQETAEAQPHHGFWDCTHTHRFVGSPATLMAKLQPMIAESQADELMIITAVYDHEARKKSYHLLADAFGLGKKAAA